MDSDELNKLADLHQRGALSDEEFSRAKARVLDRAAPAASNEPLVNALNRLRRSRSDHWIGGVCGGIARMTGLEAWMWRLMFVLLLMCAGSGLLVYLLLWIFVPLE
jgi:phage shock protein C